MISLSDRLENWLTHANYQFWARWVYAEVTHCNTYTRHLYSMPSCQDMLCHVYDLVSCYVIVWFPFLFFSIHNKSCGYLLLGEPLRHRDYNHECCERNRQYTRTDVAACPQCSWMKTRRRHFWQNLCSLCMLPVASCLLTPLIHLRRLLLAWNIGCQAVDEFWFSPNHVLMHSANAKHRQEQHGLLTPPVHLQTSIHFMGDRYFGLLGATRFSLSIAYWNDSSIIVV